MIDASAFDIAASGMTAQRENMDVIASNLANAGSVNPDGTPYAARYAVFEPSNDAANGFAASFADDMSVGTDGGDELFAGMDDSAALPQGVALTNVLDAPVGSASAQDPSLGSESDSIMQMVNLVSAGRSYDADVSALQGAKQMDVEAADIDQL